MNATEPIEDMWIHVLVQVIGAFRQQANTWANVDPDLCRHISSRGHSELIIYALFNQKSEDCFKTKRASSICNQIQYKITSGNHQNNFGGTDIFQNS